MPGNRILSTTTITEDFLDLNIGTKPSTMAINLIRIFCLDAIIDHGCVI